MSTPLDSFLQEEDAPWHGLHHGEYQNLSGEGSQQQLTDELEIEKVWDKAQRKGAWLVEAMVGSDEEAGKMMNDSRSPPSAKSIWQGDLRQELTKWGWHELESQGERQVADMSSWYVDDTIEDLGLDGKPASEGGHNINYHVCHGDQYANIRIRYQTYEVDGKQYNCSGGDYIFTINVKGGVIYGQVLVSPKYSWRDNHHRDPNPEELPELQRLSDILWGHWIRENPNIDKIKYFWMQDIANEDTHDIIGRALEKTNQKDHLHWPGVEFKMDTHAAQAILGSENGAVFAWFLIQHKEQLGNKWIPKLRVFINDRARPDNPVWHILFYVAEVGENL